jgi:hypothetical protein
VELGLDVVKCCGFQLVVAGVMTRLCHTFSAHNRDMGTVEEIKNQFQELQKSTPGADFFQIFAVMLHQEQERYAVALRTIEQYSAVITGQNTTISELQAEITKLHAENPT